MDRRNRPICHRFNNLINRTAWPLLRVQRRPADSLPFEVEIHFDMVGDLDERNALVHSVVLAVEDHFPFYLA
jgi:hypothetical protein